LEKSDSIEINNDKAILLNNFQSFSIKEQTTTSVIDMVDCENEIEKLLKDDNDDLPTNIIVSSLCCDIFTNSEIKKKFEDLFKAIDSNCTFCYFRIFNRCTVQFTDPLSAIVAKVQIDNYYFIEDTAPLRVYLSKPIKMKNTTKYLELPKQEKSFLISPPASPPVDWEQVHEDPPVVNFDLLSAISKLKPGMYYYITYNLFIIWISIIYLKLR
jgi:hypothetical protein